jgi:predicted dehydrogenase
MRHAEVLRSLDVDVEVWPVRPRPIGTRGMISGSTGEGRRRYADADLVVIATDTSRHVSDAIEALESDARRVLIEKPVAPTATDAVALATHPRADVVAVAAPLRAHEGFRSLARAVDILPGTLAASVRCHSWLPDWRPGDDYRLSYSARPSEGGVLRDLVHELDYAICLFGSPRLAGAVLDHDGPLDIRSDQAASLLWTTDRATVAVRLDYISRPSSRGVVVRSASGSVEWDVAESTVTVTDAVGSHETTVHEHDRDRNRVMATQARAFLAYDKLGDVEDAIRLSEGMPSTLGESIAVIKLCDEARSADRRLRGREGDGVG